MTLDITTTLDRLHRLAASRGAELTQPDPVKAAFIMPMLAALGHDPFDPDQVAAGYSIDQARADFAALDDERRLMIAASAVSQPDDLASPRARALAGIVAGTDAVGVLTSGREWRFHLADADGLEQQPFMAFDLSRAPVDPAAFAHLMRDSFDTISAVQDARVTRIDDIAFETLVDMLDARDAALVAVLAERVAPGAEPGDRRHDLVSDALARAASILREPRAVELEQAPSQPAGEDEDDDDRRPLTGDEEAAFREVCAIASRFVDGARIHARPAQAYLAVLLDDNNRRTICRLYFSAHSTRYVGTFVGRNETKQRITGYANVVEHGRALAERLRELDPGAFAGVDIDEALSAPAAEAPQDGADAQEAGPGADVQETAPAADAPQTGPVDAAATTDAAPEGGGAHAGEDGGENHAETSGDEGGPSPSDLLAEVGASDGAGGADVEGTAGQAPDASTTLDREADAGPRHDDDAWRGKD